MMNQLSLIRKPICLTCFWVPTGDAKRPLACVWKGSKAAPSVSFTENTGHESGRMHLCA